MDKAPHLSCKSADGWCHGSALRHPSHSGHKHLPTLGCVRHLDNVLHWQPQHATMQQGHKVHQQHQPRNLPLPHDDVPCHRNGASRQSDTQCCGTLPHHHHTHLPTGNGILPYHQIHRLPQNPIPHQKTHLTPHKKIHHHR